MMDALINQKTIVNHFCEKTFKKVFSSLHSHGGFFTSESKFIILKSSTNLSSIIMSTTHSPTSRQMI
ncbi:MAG: hypothetical protein U0K80_01110 [Methanobrevibacter sp.]|nr:hypothetical protein [Methanobrevibacter sp.]